MPKNLNTLLGALPHNQKRLLKLVRYLPAELWDRLTGRDRNLPPRWLRFDSQSDFQVVGNHLRDLCIEYGDLRPEHSVLDIGCGVGRLAAPLADFLGADASYEGFDVDKQAIDWCREAIGKQHDNFQFQHTAVNNDHYNPDGALQGKNFQFPYANDTFDFAVATSVFTHLSTRDAKHYLGETSRVLKPRGKALLTWYVLKETFTSRSADSPLNFNHPIDSVSATATPKNPLAAMAFDETFILEAMAEAGLQLLSNIYPGTWRSEDGPTHQDLVVVQKSKAED